jgi:hypothetical protein
VRIKMKNVVRWQNELRRAFHKHSMAVNTTSTMKSTLQKAGFHGINLRTVKIGLHDKSELEQNNKEYILSSFEPVALRLFTTSRWRQDEVTVLCAKAKGEVRRWAGACRSHW